jgi:hypothetical protein
LRQRSHHVGRLQVAQLGAIPGHVFIALFRRRDGHADLRLDGLELLGGVLLQPGVGRLLLLGARAARCRRTILSSLQGGGVTLGQYASLAGDDLVAVGGNVVLRHVRRDAAGAITVVVAGIRPGGGTRLGGRDQQPLLGE